MAVLKVSPHHLSQVHERDVLADFLLVLARDVLPRRPAARGLAIHMRLISSRLYGHCMVVLKTQAFHRPGLTLVLMSATLRAESFAEYFGGRGAPAPLRKAKVPAPRTPRSV
jgi:HrpA-like RNA helicase